MSSKTMKVQDYSIVIAIGYSCKQSFLDVIDYNGSKTPCARFFTQSEPQAHGLYPVGKASN